VPPLVLGRAVLALPLIPKSLRSATSIVGEEGFGEQVVADRSTDGIGDGSTEGIAAQIGKGEGRNGVANSEAIGEGSVRSGGDGSGSLGSVGSAKGAAAKSRGGSSVSGEGRSVSDAVSEGGGSISEGKGSAESGGTAGAANTGLADGCNW